MRPRRTHWMSLMTTSTYLKRNTPMQQLSSSMTLDLKSGSGLTLVNRFNIMTTNIIESLKAMLLDERGYPVATIFNLIAHKFDKIFKKRYVDVNNSRTTFIPEVEKILGKNMTEGDTLYANNINGSTDEFTMIDCGPSTDVNLL
ncbi:hypothetical protein T459_25854 [Capsicum annuum]|uniref:Uncharacterized protein n=1 Tax=Capsicum annuum TaxID=4072 RepID=A0A2G2YLY8_CAPAN|nr:hypothetical protein T459_25854 [Capsicum annuum]